MRALLLTLALPPAAPLLLGALGCVLWGRWRRVAPLLVAFGLLSAWAGASEGVVAPLARRWAPLPPPEQTLRTAQLWRGRSDTLVLVLGAGVRSGSSATGDYEPKVETMERLERGVWWARRLQVPLAFSGGSLTSAEPERPAEATVARRVLAEHHGLAPTWTEGNSANTAENARFSAPLLKQHGARRVILVTHALHMRRALRHFQAQAPEIEFLPAPLGRMEPTTWRLLNYVPSPEGVRLGHYLAYEWLAEQLGR